MIRLQYSCEAKVLLVFFSFFLSLAFFPLACFFLDFFALAVFPLAFFTGDGEELDEDDESELAVDEEEPDDEGDDGDGDLAAEDRFTAGAIAELGAAGRAVVPEELVPGVPSAIGRGDATDSGWCRGDATDSGWWMLSAGSCSNVLWLA